MAPKTEKAKPKEREKAVDDKTFGMKNKNKSAKVQKYIAGLKASATTEPKVSKDRADAELRAKKDQAEKAALLSAIFGVQPTKKKKKVDDKGKVDLYVDLRYQKTAVKDAATGEITYTWIPTGQQTEIVCKFYLDAVQGNQLGWMWQCANGDGCIYRHCLPQGYVLTGGATAANDEDEDDEPVPIEEQVEMERATLVTAQLTPVTEATFLGWLAQKKKQVEEQEEAAKKDVKTKKDLRMGTSGRELFVMDPSLFVDEDDAIDDFDRDLDYRLSDADEGEGEAELGEEGEEEEEEEEEEGDSEEEEEDE